MAGLLFPTTAPNIRAAPVSATRQQYFVDMSFLLTSRGLLQGELDCRASLILPAENDVIAGQQLRAKYH